MSATVTWKLYIDVGGNGYTSGDDYAQYMIECHAHLGFDDTRDRVAPPCHMEVVVDNSLFTFNPEVNAIAVTGKFIRLQGASGATEQPQWTGVIRDVVGAEGGVTSTLYCVGRWAFADGVVDVGVYESTTAEQVLLDVLTLGLMMQKLGPGVTAGTWMVQVPGWSEVEQTTFLGESVSDFSPAAGDTTLTYVGRNYQRPTVRQVVTDVVRAEWGLFYEDNQGQFIFQSRSGAVSIGTPASTFGGDELILDDYQFGGQIVNEVDIQLSSYVVTDGVTVWTSVAPITIKEGYTEHKLRFLDAYGRSLNLASDVIPANFVFKTGVVSGTTYALQYSIHTLANGAVLRVINPYNFKLYLQMGATLTGAILTEEVPAQQSIRNYESINRYGLRPLPFALPSFADLDAGVSVAQFVAGAYTNAEGRLRSVTISNHTAALAVIQLTYGIGYVVRVMLDDLGHDDVYTIKTIDHQITPTGYSTRYGLEKTYNFWHVEKAGFGELDETTILGY